MRRTNVAVKAVRKAVYDKVESQIHTFDAQVATLKAKAESAKAEAELNAIANLATAKRTLDQKVAELKSAGETAFQQVKAESKPASRSSTSHCRPSRPRSTRDNSDRRAWHAHDP